MSDAPEDLDPARIRAALTTARVGRSLTVVDETGSTNDDARAAARDGAPDGHAIVADRQSAGRGSRGRQWASPGGTDLYLSVLARPEGIGLARIPALTLSVGLAVVRTLDAVLEAAEAKVKWPNDALLAGRKVAGVLVEGESRGATLDALVIGIGLNVNRSSFPGELAKTATSLRLHADRTFARDAVLASLLGQLERAIDDFHLARGVPPVDAIEARLAHRGAQVRVDDATGEQLDSARARSPSARAESSCWTDRQSRRARRCWRIACRLCCRSHRRCARSQRRCTRSQARLGRPTSGGGGTA